MRRFGLLSLLGIRLSTACSYRNRKMQSSPKTKRATSHRPSSALWHLARWLNANRTRYTFGHRCIEPLFRMSASTSALGA
ncbi:hypothetical protein ARMGADRAFT_1020964 [Armillaria gallica]|uniref:Secreted protein n=1 Tax=Armillaria gallica TaxID=47427 RepID=A0A2H3CB95_ARMGA|nr:hypothetical protein ARMGADRAFT_1020964 [Armillaria gallica]